VRRTGTGAPVILFPVLPRARSESLEVGGHHDLHEFVETDFGSPPELTMCLGGVSPQVVNLGGPVELSIHVDVRLPILDPGGLERFLDELLDRVRLPGRSDEIARRGVLQRLPHQLHVGRIYS
jgi:hypothetical protein